MANHLRVIVAIGANLPSRDANPIQACERAARAIAALPGVDGLTRSRWFSSAPVPASDQPRFVNGAVAFRSGLDAADLLGRLHDIEYLAGRARPVPNAARTLDLDIIDIGGVVRSAPDPVLPHPRAHLRLFVLLPLRDVVPDWRHPATGSGISALLAALPPQDVVPC